jgi:hypothetical protein
MQLIPQKSSLHGFFIASLKSIHSKMGTDA